MTLFDLTGRVAIVTGSSRGIGLAIAERLAEHGAKVVISSRNPDACTAVATRINEAHGAGAAIAVAANISSKTDLRRLVDEADRAFGRVDILVCNAATNPYYGPMGGIEDDQVPQDLREQRALEPLANPDGRTEDDRAEGWRDCHRLFDRRAQGFHRARRLLRVQGRRFPARPKPRGRMGQAQCPGELHRPRPDQDRFCSCALGESRHPEGSDLDIPDAQDRLTRRNRWGGGLPRLPSGLFPYRPGHRHRRRRYHRRRLSATETRNSISNSTDTVSKLGVQCRTMLR